MKPVNTATTITAFALALIANDAFDGNDAEANLAPAGDMTVTVSSRNVESTLTAADIPKNPGISVNASELPYSMHRRQSVTYNEIEYSSAGRIFKNGNKKCSGDAIVLEEYETVPESGILVSSAAHCFENHQPDDDYKFVLDFLDENDVIRTYTYTNPEIWANPRKNKPQTSQPHVDQALVFFPDLSLPDEITPGRLEIYSEHIVNDFADDHFDYIDITAAGYSRDIFGLSRDTDCSIKTVYTSSEKSPYLKTNCQIYLGGSGSGLTFENFANEDPRQKTIGAITASIAKNIDVGEDDFFSHYTLFYHHNLAEVPFLRRKDICARVTAESGLFVRNENYNENGSALTSLPFNEVVYVTDMLYDEQGRYGADNVWLEVRKQDNPDIQTPDGYANSGWLEEIPCPSAPAP